MVNKMNEKRMASSIEVQKVLRKELIDYEAYLPNRYSTIIFDRLEKKYSRLAIRQTRAGQIHVTAILTELVKLAKEEYKSVSEALK